MRSQDHAPHTRAVTSGQPARTTPEPEWLCFLCDAGGVCNGECETDIEHTLQGACYE